MQPHDPRRVATEKTLDLTRCDIIVIFGRRPRLKTAAQVLAELEALRVGKMEIVFSVVDNLIGNNRAIKEILRDDRGLRP